MKIRLLISMLLALLCAGASTSCRELSQIGDLAGQWQVLSIDYPDGTTVDPQGAVFYNFYRDVAQLRDNDGGRSTASMAYDEQASKMTLHFPYSSPYALAQWGITCPDPELEAVKDFTISFDIKTLTSDRLVITSQYGVTISMRKF